MLTEEFLKDNLISAYFIDNDRQNIELMCRTEDHLSVFTEILPFDENNEQYKILSKVVSLDELHETTWEKKKEERKEYEAELKRIANKEGLLKQIIESVDADFFKLLFDFFLSDKPEHIERLFNFKIYIFEQDIVKNSKNESIKTALRRSKTPLETFKYFLQLWEENNQTTNQKNQDTSNTDSD